MLKPRVPGYHGNQIKRKISSESRNLNYSDSFMKGKMKIPFTVQRPLHCKGRRKEGEKKDEENAIVFLYLTTQFKAIFHAIEIHRLPHDNRYVNTQHTCTKEWCNRSVSKTRDKPIAFEKYHNVCIYKSSTEPGTCMMKSISCVHGIRCDWFWCGKRFYLKEQDEV